MGGAEATGVAARLDALVAQGRLDRDAAQSEAARALDAVCARLANPKRGGLLGLQRQWPDGLYLWGGVGRGKSMLMDWFFESAPVRDKRRVHFHSFMLEVHAGIHRARKNPDKPLFGEADDPVETVAEQVVESARLLCFDEFHVTDITDAMILSRLFARIWEEGCTVVATSNRAPEDLYKNGLNRQLFTPFIDLLRDNMVVHHVGGDTDHRLRVLENAELYHSPLGPEADAAIDAVWRDLIGEATPHPTTLAVQGRDLVIEQTAAGVARASFERLCEQPLGPADYLGLAQSFQTLILEGVPKLGRADRNAAKRFNTLVDALYETRTKLVMSADAEPDELYTEGDGAFEFERTASRLAEMRTRDYLAQNRKLDGGR